MKFQHFSDLAGVTTTTGGYILADVKAARTGIQQYAGWEVGKPELPVVNVYRPKDSVFARDSLETFPNIPLTLGHPDTPVSAETYDAENVGNVFEVVPDGESIRASIQIMSKRAIDAIADGTRQLSVGYDAELEWGDGTTPDGETYHATQKNIRANHLAIVTSARAGPEYRIGDTANKWGIAPITQTEKKETTEMSDTLKTVVLGDAAVNVPLADVAALENYKAKVTTDADAVQATHDAVIADKDKELATKDAEIADLKTKVLDEAAIDARVASKAKLVSDAKSISKDLVTDGLSDAEIRKAAVVVVRGADAIADKSEAYIDAAFELALEDAGKEDGDKIKDTLADGVKTDKPGDLNTAYSTRDSDLSGSWKRTAKEA